MGGKGGGHSATYAESKKDCLRDGILQALLLSVRLDTAFLIDIAFMNGREKKWMGEERSGGHSATYAESRREGLRDGILQALLLSMLLDTAFLRYDV